MRRMARLLAFILFISSALARIPGTKASPVPLPHDSLHELSDSIQGLSKNVSRAVVQVFSTAYALSDDDSTSSGNAAGVVTKQRSSGSGVILSPDGFIMTSNHVVKNARRVRVQLAPGEPNSWPGASLQTPGKFLDAHIVGVDHEADLAVLKVDPPAPLHFLKLGDSDTLKQGQLVLAFGNPLGLVNSVSLGVVSSVGRQIHRDDPMVYIQTDAPINPGNSGGPLLDINGTVVGINTFIMSQSGGSEGIGFAVPSNLVASIYDQIRRDGHVHRGEIGATVQTITPELAAGLKLRQNSGVILEDVIPGGPAQSAGLEPGDIVLAFDNHAMENARQFDLALYRMRRHGVIDLQVLRANRKFDVQVPVSERMDDKFRFLDLVKPEENLIPKLGVIAVPITPMLARILPDTRKPYGIIVAGRTGPSEYNGQGGLKPGDVIYSLNATPMVTLEALREAVNRLSTTDPLVVQIERDGKLLYLTLSEE